MMLAAALLWLSACQIVETATRPTPAVVFHADQGDVRVVVEVADTPKKRERGLMYRKALADEHGMLFVFPAASDHTFWMKNTYIPLDMIFINEKHTVVGVVANAEPMILDPQRVGRPSLYVVEVRGGYAARRGIRLGTRVTLSDALAKAAH